MANNTIINAKKIKRIFVETHDTTTYVKFTLVDDKNIYKFHTRENTIRENLEFTQPGDEVSFEYGTTGWLLKDIALLKFENITLNKEIGKTN
jgi:hypothetical protein